MNHLESHTPRPLPYRERLSAGIERYSADDRTDLLAFRRAMHGPESPACNPEHVRWLFEETPRARSAGMSDLWLCRLEGQIVGQQGAIPTALKIGNGLYDAAWAIHLLVDPAYQLRGIGALLSERCCEEHQILLGLEVTEEARRAFVRAGWIDLGRVPLFVRVLDAARVFRHHWSSPWAGPLGHLVNVALAAANQVIRLRAGHGHLRMEEVERFDTRVDQLWERLSHHYPVVCRRDARELNWRHADFPDPTRYRLFYFEKNTAKGCPGELVGYAVLRLDYSEPRRPAGHIVDYLCAPDHSWFVLAQCLNYLQRAGMAVAYCLSSHPSSAAALGQLGFIRRESAWPLMFRARDLSPHAMGQLCRMENWFITAGDSDVDRPRELIRLPPGLRWEVASNDQTSAFSTPTTIATSTTTLDDTDVETSKPPLLA